VRVTVVGLGYVGLVTAACLVEWGHRVRGIDANRGRIADLRAGRMPFYEPGLDRLVARGIAAKALEFSSKAASSLRDADLVVVAVGTHDGNGAWQTATILACLEEIVPHLAPESTLVIRSTLPPDFVESLPEIVARARGALPPVAVLLNPEFTREGRAVRDFLNPDRVVIGIAHDPGQRGVAVLRSLYGGVSAPVLVMSAPEAALSKLGSNLFLATKISFANELAGLCDLFGAGVDPVVAALSLDPRIGAGFLGPGVGFGGSCLPHQVAMTVRAAGEHGYPTPLLGAVAAVNESQRRRFAGRLAALLGGLPGSRIALLGLTFKPGTDDLRDAPSLAIGRHLLAAGARVVAHDPMASARERALGLVAGLEVAPTALEALRGADAAGLVTEWPEFCEIDWDEAGRLMRRRIVVDGRNALSPEMLRAAGFVYSAFGRGPRHVLDRSPVAVTVETEPDHEPGTAATAARRARPTNGATNGATNGRLPPLRALLAASHGGRPGQRTDRGTDRPVAGLNGGSPHGS
jgi:UDPglucose 6-dehydrogenase